jgi:hypothetical protein
MNGAMAELLATTRSKPTITSVITMGASQNFLFSRINCQSSLTTNSLDIFVLNVRRKISTSSRNVVDRVAVQGKDASKTALLALAGARDPSPLLS